jgi:integrase
VKRSQQLPIYKRTWKKPDGTKRFRYYLHKTINGERHKIPIPTARTKAEAETAAIKIAAEIHAGIYGNSKGSITLKEFVDKTFTAWTKEHKRSWRSDLSRLKPIVAFFGKKRLKDISPFEVESYKLKRLKTPVKYKQVEKPRTVASVNRELQLLSRVFTLAIEKRETVGNPCSEVNLFPGEHKRKRRLYPEEEARLFEALSSEKSQNKRTHLGAMIKLYLHTGLRRTELLSLKSEHIDFFREVILVTNTKSGEDREVEMSDTAKTLLTELVEQAKAEDWEYLFTNPKTGTRYKDIKKAFKNAVRDAGLTDLRLHDLRHEFASTAGDDPEVSVTALAETLGHKNLKTTMQYTHASKAGKLKVVQAQEKKEVLQAGRKSVANEKRQAS